MPVQGAPGAQVVVVNQQAPASGCCASTPWILFWLGLLLLGPLTTIPGSFFVCSKDPIARCGGIANIVLSISWIIIIILIIVLVAGAADAISDALGSSGETGDECSLFTFDADLLCASTTCLLNDDSSTGRVCCGDADTVTVASGCAKCGGDDFNDCLECNFGYTLNDATGECDLDF